MQPARIVIVGGGFGGVRTALDIAQRLGDRGEVTLIDRNNYHLFTPLLYEVASAFGTSPDRFSVSLRKTISIPFEEIFQGTRVRFIEAEVAGISLIYFNVTKNSDSVYSYDYLVLALGSQAAHYNIPGVREYAYQFKTIEDALMLHHHLTFLYDRASRGEEELPIRIVVGGGGFTGVELAAEIAGTARKLAESYNLPRQNTLITLIEAGSKIMPAISEGERAAIVRRLTKLGIVIREHCGIEHIAGESLRLSNGATVKHHILAWTAGIHAHDFLKMIQGLDLTTQGKVIVDEHLNTVRHPNVFAVGDIIEFIDHRTQKPEPALAYIAIQHGQVVAQNIERSMKGKELKSHKPFYDLWIAPVGGKYAVAHLSYGVRLRGFLGWVVREFTDLRYFISILSVRRALRLMREEVDVFLKND
jgi:NADH dehydrogenase